MTDITNSDVYVFIKWVTAMHPAIYHLARPLLHGVCRLHEIAEAKRVTRDYPTHAARYDFIGVLAGGNPAELPALKEEATRELVADFYAWDWTTWDRNNWTTWNHTYLERDP